MLRAAAAVAIGVVLAARTVDASPCVAAVVITGDPPLTATLTATLAARGLAAPSANCRAERVTVERVESGVRLAIVDVDGRRAERSIDDLATAAILIESFAQPGDPIAPAASVRTAPSDLEQPRILVMASPSHQLRGSLGIAAESQLGSDGSVWFGSLIHACVDLGPACVGGAVRITKDAALGGDSETMESSRTGYDVLLAADLPLGRDGWQFVPGFSVGTGWLHLRRDIVGVSGTDTIEVDAGGLRADVHVHVALPLTAGVFLTLGASLGVAPNAHTMPYTDEGGTVAGEPRASGRVELGLELGRR